MRARKQSARPIADIYHRLPQLAAPCVRCRVGVHVRSVPPVIVNFRLLAKHNGYVV